jgi:hypothetical protein
MPQQIGLVVEAAVQLGAVDAAEVVGEREVPHDAIREHRRLGRRDEERRPPTPPSASSAAGIPG